jgi:uncharacterized protein YcbX
VRPEFDPDMQRLTLHMPDGRRVSGPIELGEPLTMSTSRRRESCHEVLEPFAGALSSLAGRPVRLVRFDEVGVGVDRAREGGAATLLSAASLDAIAEVAGDGPVDARRFRMLFGVSGVPPHAEDGWLRQTVRIGDATVMPMGNVGRCAVTTLDPETGRSDLDTLAALAVYRRDVDTTEALPFGVWARVVEPGRVAVGDDVIV